MKATLTLVEQDSPWWQPGLPKPSGCYRMVSAEVKYTSASNDPVSGGANGRESDLQGLNERLLSFLRREGISEIEIQNGRELNDVELITQREYRWEENGMTQFTKVSDHVFEAVKSALALAGIVVRPLGEVTVTWV